jgi:spore maturation protein CgeB
VTGHLAANLHALAGVNAALAERLCLPVSDEHVRLDPDGSAHLVVQQSAHRLSLAPAEVVAATPAVAAGADVLVVGIGLGEQVAHLLAHAGQVTVWDRDPWLIRLALDRLDLAESLASGRLRVALGADLLDELTAAPQRALVLHPVLRHVYANELDLALHGLTGARALVCAGALFCDDLAAALRADGFRVYTWDVARLAVEELCDTLRRFDPEIVCAINYTHGLAELCAEHDRPLLCWEIDPATDRVAPNAATHTSHIFTYRKANLAAYRAAGFARVHYLPLASNPDRRAPVALTPAETERYAAPVAFVGASMVEQAAHNQGELGELYAALHGGSPAAAAAGRALFADILAAQRADFDRYLIADLMEERCGAFLAAARAVGKDAVMLLAETAAAERRCRYVSTLGRHGVHVWGDAGWQQATAAGARYMGPAGHHHELTKVYCGARINVDINRIYQTDMVTMRVFDVLACGAFILAEHSDALAELFAIGVEVESYRGEAELLAKVGYYLARPEQARAIAARGRTAICERHTILQRVRVMRQLMALPAR